MGESLMTDPVLTALAALDEELDLIDADEKASFLKAKSLFPDFVSVNTRHEVAALVREESDPKRAAHRLVKYWQSREETFPGKLFVAPLKLGLSGALQNDPPILLSGFVTILPAKDSSGRTIISFDYSHYNPEAFTLESMARALWFLLEVAEEGTAQQVAEVAIIESFKDVPANAKIREFFERKLAVMKSVLAKTSALHFVHLDSSSEHGSAILGLIKAEDGVLMKLHNGSDADVLQSLDKEGFPKTAVPKALGGDCIMDARQWFADRLASEDSATAAANSATVSSSANSASLAWQPTSQLLQMSQQVAPTQISQNIGMSSIPGDFQALAALLMQNSNGLNQDLFSSNSLLGSPFSQMIMNQLPQQGLGLLGSLPPNLSQQHMSLAAQHSSQQQAAQYQLQLQHDSLMSALQMPGMAPAGMDANMPQNDQFGSVRCLPKNVKFASHSLYDPDDESALSKQLCLTRQQLEFFAANDADVKERGSRGGRTHRIFLGRIGMRCIHCTHLPIDRRAKGSVAFPASLDNIYQGIRNWKRDHFAVCKEIPDSVRKKMETCGTKRSARKEVKNYVAETAHRLGLGNYVEDGGFAGIVVKADK